MTTFVIPGKPFAKQRPRFSRRSRRSGRAFTPSETVSFERTVGVIASEHFQVPITGPVRLKIAAVFQPPKSWSKKKAAEHLNRSHTQKPDLDNIAKAIKDGLNRIAFADDSQVAACDLVKVWGPSEHTIVTVERLSE